MPEAVIEVIRAANAADAALYESAVGMLRRRLADLDAAAPGGAVPRLPAKKKRVLEQTEKKEGAAGFGGAPHSEL